MRCRHTHTAREAARLTDRMGGRYTWALHTLDSWDPRDPVPASTMLCTRLLADGTTCLRPAQLCAHVRTCCHGPVANGIAVCPTHVPEVL